VKQGGRWRIAHRFAQVEATNAAPSDQEEHP
jgi:hypothetical protein